MKKYILGNHTKKLEYSHNPKNYTIYNETEKLFNLKCKIDTCNPKKWEESKKLLNPYELIYTSSKKNNNICRINPVSRSYFKLHEMIHVYNLLYNEMYCACIAEGPGGFIHCLNNSQYTINTVYGITLISKDKNIPYWNQGIINNKKNRIINGKNNNGNLYEYENLFLLDRTRLIVEKLILKKDRVILKFIGINTRNDAEYLRDKDLYVEEKSLPELNNNEAYHFQLKGLTVKNSQNKNLGKIKEILETKANDVLIIEPTKGSIDKNERLVPYIKDEIVKQINIAEKTILIDWPEDF